MIDVLTYCTLLQSLNIPYQYQLAEPGDKYIISLHIFEIFKKPRVREGKG